MKRVLPVQESDLRMDGALAMNIQRVLPVKQTDIDAAAAQGKSWLVERVVQVNTPLDNCRGGTMRVIKQNSILPGQNVVRVLIENQAQEVKVSGVPPLVLPDAVEDDIVSLTAFGGIRQGLPSGYDPVNFIYFLDGAYLQTDIVPTYDGKVEMDFATTTVVASAAILGGRTISYGGLFMFLGSDNKFVVDAFSATSTNRYTSTVTAQNNTRYKFTFNNKVGTLESGGTTLFTNTFAGTEANGKELIINGNNNNGSVTGNTEGIYLYSFKVWDNQGKLVANYVPCAKTNPLTVGLYDLVSDTFINAPTSGTWAAGPAAGASVNPTPDAPIDIVCNNGVLKFSPNLVEFNETRITSSTWATADKTKGFEIAADVYGKTIGNSLGSNGNCFGVFVPCKKGESISLDFFNYEPYYTRCFYCEVDADFKVLTTPAQFADSSSITQKTFTATNDNCIGFAIEWFISANQTRNYNKENYMVVRGTTPPTRYIPYGQIYTDGLVETINVHGKNLSYGDLSNAGYSSTGGVSSSTTLCGNLWKIKCAEGEKYTASCGNFEDGISGFYVSTWKTDGTWSQRQAVSATSGVVTYTIPASVSEVNFTIYKTGGITIGSTSWLQVERGDTATDYEPYFDGGTATAEMLLKVDDTYQDQQEIVAGNVTRKVAVKVLDGTDVWGSDAVGTGGYIRFSLTIAGKAKTYAILSNMFAPKTGVVGTNESQALISGHASYAAIYLSFPANLLSGDLTTSAGRRAAFNNWLSEQYAAGTPVIIVYPLETATTESVTAQPMHTELGDNTVSITQASLDDLELSVTYLAGVQLTVEEVEDAQLSQDVEVTIQ